MNDDIHDADLLPAESAWVARQSQAGRARIALGWHGRFASIIEIRVWRLHGSDSTCRSRTALLESWLQPDIEILNWPSSIPVQSWTQYFTSLTVQSPSG
ncbi:hypothetical protein [Variovorax gossypii]